MVDIHTHILPNIDDGSYDIEDTMEILKKAKIAGYDSIIATPHYIKGTYDADMLKKTELLESVKNEAKKRGIDIEIYLGNEIFISEDILKDLKNGKIASMNNTKYILVELPLNDEILNFQTCIFNIISSGYTPIIAHPERYAFVNKNPNNLIKYINQGVLIQVNTGSLIGFYGKTVKNTAEILLKNNMVNFVATDTHHSKSVSYNQIDNIKKILIKLVGVEKLNILTTENPRKVIYGKYIESEEPVFYKKKIFGFF